MEALAVSLDKSVDTQSKEEFHDTQNVYHS